MKLYSVFFKVANKIVRHTNWYNQYWGGVSKFWKLQTFNLDVVNLGSNSGKYAFNYESIHLKCMNWAIDPQSLVHDFNVLKNYFSYLKNGATVIIPLCPFSALVSNYSLESNLKYYTFLHPATILDFDERERIKAIEIKNNPFKNMPFFCLKQTLKEIVKNVFKKNLQKVDYETNALLFINMWKEQFGINNLDDALESRHLTDIENRALVLSQMIEFCLERNLQPVLVIPPLHPALSRLLTDTFRKNYIFHFIEQANTKKVPFYNCMDDKFFQEDKYYYNAFLMNEEGAKLFTNSLLAKL